MMNKELINKLRQEAWQYANNYAGDDVMPQLQRFEQKFAELIVQECMGLVDGYTYPVQTQSHTIYHIASETIKQHFGVEE